MKRLTDQQQAVYDYIRGCILSRGYGPTVREIGEHMDIRSPNGVMCHLRALEKKGVIFRSANKSRAIELAEPLQRVEPAWEVKACLTAGIVTPNLEPLPKVRLGSLFGGQECFLIELLDDKLLADHQLRRGDKIVLRQCATVLPGQLLLCRHDKGTGWIFGRCQTSDDLIVLQPLSEPSPCITLEKNAVAGTAVGIVRML
jgi:repressor LexA